MIDYQNPCYNFISINTNSRLFQLLLFLFHFCLFDLATALPEIVELSYHLLIFTLLLQVIQLWLLFDMMNDFLLMND